MRTRPFGSTDRSVALIGQGTWNIPTSGRAAQDAVGALRMGIELGLTHIDTAEMYGSGGAEEIVADAIAGLPRDALFIVSKVLPSNAGYAGTIRACEQSLQRLGTDYLDCYLLHWRAGRPLSETMRALEKLADDGKIRSLGVSNFDVEDLEEASSHLRRHPIACNQVLYHLGERGIERRLLPYCQQHRIAVVGYSPFGSGDFPTPRSVAGRVLATFAERYRVSAHAVALAFLTRLEGTFTIPKAARVEHVRENAASANLVLDDDATDAIGTAFPLPDANGPLAML